MSDQFILDIRELINVELAVFAGVMTVLFARYVWREWHAWGYRGLGFEGRAAIGFGFITAGEFARALVIWGILREERPGTYLLHALPLIFSIAAIAIGSLCCIRVFSPTRWGNWPWLASLALAAALGAWTLFAHDGGG